MPATTTMKGVAYQNYTCRSGNSYTADANGWISGVLPGDVLDLVNGGVSFIAVGNPVNAIALSNVKNADGTPLAASAAAGKFGLGITLGTSEVLSGEAAQNNTKTSNGLVEIVLPPSYVAGSDITLTVNAKFAGSGTAGTKTIDAVAYEMSNAGASSADLVETAAQNLTTSNADYAFVIAGDSLVPGDRLLVQVTTALQETGNAATITASINSIRFA